MARILVTGSTTGLGLAAALELIDAGHEVLVHARSAERAAAFGPISGRAAGVVIGDLGEVDETLDLAQQVNRYGRMDAVIHNAGFYDTQSRSDNSRGQPTTCAVNVVAPYLLTALLDTPSRLIYLSSNMHTSGIADLDDLEWNTRTWNPTQAYRDSKLLVTTLAFAVARSWPDVRSNAVNPGWVATRMGGPSASDDLILGHRTQVWLATSDEQAAAVSGRYWFHQRQLSPAPVTLDTDFQDRLVARLTEFTGVQLTPG